MHWQTETLLVGFRVPTTDQAATSYLRAFPGFRRILHWYRLTNAALIQVSPDRLPEFVAQLQPNEYIEYCEYNYYLRPCGFFVDSLGSWSSAKLFNNAIARQLHNITPRIHHGWGVSVATIDSGMNPHPLLPATSFTQLLGYPEWMPRLGRDNKHVRKAIEDLAKEEQLSPSPLSSRVDKQRADDFARQMVAASHTIVHLLWDDWQREASNWHKAERSRQLIRQFGSATAQYSRPPLPALFTCCGAFRRISPYSYNFVENNLAVEDNVGHGTEMAGIICGRCYLEELELPPLQQVPAPKGSGYHDQFNRYSVDPLGISPSCELVVLKCYDSYDIEASTLDAMIRALEHAEQVKVDVVYVGLQFDLKSHVKHAITLDRTITALARQYIPVICPAGNDGQSGLAFPAACADAIAVTGVVGSSGGYSRAPYSNYALATERVGLCAFGGSPDQALVTTTRHFGVSGAYGTSVAAAIGVGIIAHLISADYRTTIERDYRHELDKTLSDAMFQWAYNPLKPNRIPIVDLLQRISMHASKPPSNAANASQFYGSGLIRSP